MSNEQFKQPFSVVLNGGEVIELSKVKQLEIVQYPSDEDKAGLVAFIQRDIEPTTSPMEGYFLLDGDGNEMYDDWEIMSDSHHALLKLQLDQTFRKVDYSLVGTYAGRFLVLKE